jgi:hypothetical protein
VLQKSVTNSKADKKSRINLFRVQNDINSEFFAMRNDHTFDTDVGAREWIDQGFGVVVSDLQGYAEIIRYGTGTGASANDRMVNISAGDITDADIVETWDAVTTGATVNHTYRGSDGAFARDSFAQVFPMKYNLNGTPTALGNGDFGVFRLFLVKSSLNNTAPQFISEMHTAKFANLTAAQTAIAGGTISNYGGFDKDLAQAGFVVVVMNASGGYVAEARVAKTTLRQVTAGTGTGSTASNVLTDVSAFNGALGATETTVQAALNKLDDAVGNSRAINASTTLLASDDTLIVTASSGNVDLTLPAGAPVGKTIRVYVESGPFSANLLPQSGYNIDGYTTSVPLKIFVRGSVTVMHIGGEVWRILLTENLNFRAVTASSSNMLAGEELVRLIPGANQTFYIYSTTGVGKRLTILRDKFQGTSYTCTVQDGSGAYINNLQSIKLAPGEMITLFAGNGEWFIESTTGTANMQTAPAKATPIDADSIGLVDSADNNALKKLTWANLLAAIRATAHIFTSAVNVKLGSTSAFVVEKANGADVFSVDTTNGKAVVTGNLEVSGFSQLGTSGPKIKIKKLTGTTADEENALAGVPHGLDSSKILSVTGLVFTSTSESVPPGADPGINKLWTFEVDSTDIVITTVIDDSSEILSKPVILLVTYEE